jgi:DegV family protein with EDD domain
VAVVVVTDTTHYLPDELSEAHGFQAVSLYVNWPDRQDRESELENFDAFYAALRTATELPTTSQPSVGDFLAVYEPILDAGDDIVSVHLSGVLSGTVRAAEQAREELIAARGLEPGRLVVLDSTTSCAGQGQVATAVAAAGKRGASAVEAADAGRRAREGVRIIFAVDTLEYMRRGGRIGAASAYLGTALKIKPILTFEAEVTPIARVRTSGRAFEHLAGDLEERARAGCDAWYVQHIQAPEEAERMVERGRSIFGSEPEAVSEIGPVIGTHVGPGLLGVSAIRRELLEAR